MYRAIGKSAPAYGATGKYNKRRRARAASNTWLAGFFIATCLTTVVYFVAIRRHNVDLSFDQLSKFERQKQEIGDYAAYFSEQPAAADLLTTLSREDWAKISRKIDLVAFVFDDMYMYSSNAAWTTEVAGVFGKNSTFDPPGFGMALFPCGCVIPNTVFTWSANRFHGLECAMLPGFVFPKEHVYWVNDTASASVCKGRKSMHPERWYEDNEWKLGTARADFVNLKETLRAKRAHELSRLELKGGSSEKSWRRVSS